MVLVILSIAVPFLILDIHSGVNTDFWFWGFFFARCAM